MKTKSNRYLKYCVQYEKYKFRSTNTYKLLVSLIYATGIMDLITSCCLIYGCSQMMDALVELEEFDEMFPKLMAEMAKMVGDLTGRLLDLSIDDDIGNSTKLPFRTSGLDVQYYDEIVVWAFLTFKVSSILLLGAALFSVALSFFLFYGLYKRNSTFCFIWYVCFCVSLFIYFVLALVVFVCDFFILRLEEWIVVLAFGFYRFAALVTVYRFQRKFLFISTVNELVEYWSNHED